MTVSVPYGGAVFFNNLIPHRRYKTVKFRFNIFNIF